MKTKKKDLVTKLKSINVVLSSHTVFNWGPDENLGLYLLQCNELLYLRHPFEEKVSHPSSYEIFRLGKKITKKQIGSTYPKLISYLKDFIVTQKVIFKQNKKYDLFIGLDPLNAFSGLFSKWFKRTKYVIYFTIDYNTQRFRNPILNFLYKQLDWFCLKHSDRIWQMTQSIIDVYVSKGIDRKKCNLIPFQVDKLYFQTFDKPLKPVVGFIGALYPEKGVELIIDSIPKIIKKIPSIKFVIIGGGPLEKELHDRAKSLGVEQYIDFIGQVPSHEKAMNILLKCSIGLAPYLIKENSYSSMGPGYKIYDYAACGLPIIITRWKEIEEKGLGLTIDYNVNQMSEAIIKLLSNRDLHEKCSKNVYSFARDHLYNKVCDEAFSNLKIMG